VIRCPAHLDTERLTLRRPVEQDAQAIFERYAADPDVTRYVGWPAHRSVEDSTMFVAFSDAEWESRGGGPYLIYARDTGALLGSTGLAFETSYRAATGYVLARDAWGHGYATEALRAMVGVARGVRIERLYALCHAAHRASARVLEKCEFQREGVLRRYAEFPNLPPVRPCDVLVYSLLL
jgi:[ribosomal protein S5]-alanine N-acetyltransferase